MSWGRYGALSGDALSELTHRESPWRDARACLAPDTRSRRVIPLDAMARYYGAQTHPFREGNGRAQRAFFRQLVAAAGWRLDWSGVDPRDNATACEQAWSAGSIR